MGSSVSGDGFGAGDGDRELARMMIWRIRPTRGTRGRVYQLGLAYHRGVGAELDLEKSQGWLNKAANAKNTAAMVRLGDMYRTQRDGGVGWDPDKAFGWYKMAADGGNILGIYSVAACYEIRDVGSKNSDLANQLYDKAGRGQTAAVQNDADAMYMLGMGEPTQRLGGEWTRNFPAQVAAWYDHAADAGKPEAMMMLANCYFRGVGGRAGCCQVQSVGSESGGSGICAGTDGAGVVNRMGETFPGTTAARHFLKPR